MSGPLIVIPTALQPSEAGVAVEQSGVLLHLLLVTPVPEFDALVSGRLKKSVFPPQPSVPCRLYKFELGGVPVKVIV